MSIYEEAQAMIQKLEEGYSATVSLALFGQPGAGKSSLINKIAGKKLTEAGIETDKTVSASRHEINGIFFDDLPGYGTKNFPKESFFQKFDINSYDLFLCVTSGKLHQADTEFFQELNKRGKVCIFVVNKHDELWEEDVSIEELEKRKINDITKHVGQPVEIVFTSCRNNTGIDNLNIAIEEHLDEAKRERWARSAKAYSTRFLEEKKAACEKLVYIAAGAAAANGINPIPGADIAVDVTIIAKLFKEIRENYGLNENKLISLKESSIPIVGRLANNVVQYIAKEGIIMLLKSFAGRQLLKTTTKYIPFVGQAIAASIGFAITTNAGTSYLDDCHALAEAILANKLDK